MMRTTVCRTLKDEFGANGLAPSSDQVLRSGLEGGNPLPPVSRKNPQTGMTLVEVLLAAFILGVGMMVLVTASSRCVAVMRKAAVFQAARWTLDRGEADNPLIRTNDIKMLEVDAVEYPGGMFYERIVEDDEDEDGLFVIRSRVSWSSHEKTLFEEAVRYMLEDPSAKK